SRACRRVSSISAHFAKHAEAAYQDISRPLAFRLLPPERHPRYVSDTHTLHEPIQAPRPRPKLGSKQQAHQPRRDLRRNGTNPVRSEQLLSRPVLQGFVLLRLSNRTGASETSRASTGSNKKHTAGRSLRLSL